MWVFYGSIKFIFIIMIFSSISFISQTEKKMQFSRDDE